MVIKKWRLFRCRNFLDKDLITLAPNYIKHPYAEAVAWLPLGFRREPVTTADFIRSGFIKSCLFEADEGYYDGADIEAFADDSADGEIVDVIHYPKR